MRVGRGGGDSSHPPTAGVAAAARRSAPPPLPPPPRRLLSAGIMPAGASWRAGLCLWRLTPGGRRGGGGWFVPRRDIAARLSWQNPPLPPPSPAVKPSQMVRCRKRVPAVRKQPRATSRVCFFVETPLKVHPRDQGRPQLAERLGGMGLTLSGGRPETFPFERSTPFFCKVLWEAKKKPVARVVYDPPSCKYTFRIFFQIPLVECESRSPVPPPEGSHNHGPVSGPRHP